MEEAFALMLAEEEASTTYFTSNSAHNQSADVTLSPEFLSVRQVSSCV